jgi:hypothetical protein
MMKNRMQRVLIAMTALAFSACSGPEEETGHRVDASGKVATELSAVPADVLAAVHAAMPDLNVSAAEYETRDGNEYYDVGGTVADGSEWELDMTKINGVWTVVEKQRDIGMDLVPKGVGNTLDTKFPGWAPERIIESDQGKGVTIYEFFGKTETGEATKIEVLWEDGRAELLIDEWLH